MCSNTFIEQPVTFMCHCSVCITCIEMMNDAELRTAACTCNDADLPTKERISSISVYTILHMVALILQMQV